MKRAVMVGASLVMLVLMGVVTVMGGEMPMGSQGGAQEPSSGPSSMMGRGMMGILGPDLLNGLRLPQENPLCLSAHAVLFRGCSGEGEDEAHRTDEGTPQQRP
jgi:hypothetical protein